MPRRKGGKAPGCGARSARKFEESQIPEAALWLRRREERVPLVERVVRVELAVARGVQMLEDAVARGGIDLDADEARAMTTQVQTLQHRQLRALDVDREEVN